jgi:hypothetical protein
VIPNQKDKAVKISEKTKASAVAPGHENGEDYIIVLYLD